VLDHRYTDCDRLVERVVERTLFSFRTNKRIFNSVMALQQAEQWQLMVRGLGERSRYPLPAGAVDRFNGLCTAGIRDLLVQRRRSACQAADPTGREALARATALRRKLRSLKRRGEIPDAVAAELNTLRPSAASRAHRPRRSAGREAVRWRRRTTQSRMRPATSSLGRTGSDSASPSASSSCTMLVSDPKPAPGAVTSLATTRSRCFSRSLRVASSVTAWVSAANPI